MLHPAPRAFVEPWTVSLHTFRGLASGPTREGGVPRPRASPGPDRDGAGHAWSPLAGLTGLYRLSAARVVSGAYGDWCHGGPALLPSGQSDEGVRPVPSSSLPWVCVDAPARLSLRFAHASGRPVPLTQDARHARNSGEFWKDHNLGRLAHRVEVPNEEHQRCLSERAHLVREDS
jgi:hypothetical protein